MEMSAHDDQICDVISQSQRYARTYSPGAMSDGTLNPSSNAYDAKLWPVETRCGADRLKEGQVEACAGGGVSARLIAIGSRRMES